MDFDLKETLPFTRERKAAASLIILYDGEPRSVDELAHEINELELVSRKREYVGQVVVSLNVRRGFMKLSFDGIRMNLAQEFNELAETELSSEQREIMRELRMTIGGLLAAYDERDQPDDCNMLADRIELAHIPFIEDEDEEIHHARLIRRFWLATKT